MAAHLDPTEARARRVILQLEVDLVEIRVEQVHHEPERAAFARGPDPARCRSSLTDTLHTEAPQRSGGSVCSIQFGRHLPLLTATVFAPFAFRSSKASKA
jgi:hypothetical protein